MIVVNELHNVLRFSSHKPPSVKAPTIIVLLVCISELPPGKKLDAPAGRLGAGAQAQVRLRWLKLCVKVRVAPYAPESIFAD